MNTFAENSIPHTVREVRCSLGESLTFESVVCVIPTGYQQNNHTLFVNGLHFIMPYLARPETKICILTVCSGLFTIRGDHGNQYHAHSRFKTKYFRY